MLCILFVCLFSGGLALDELTQLIKIGEMYAPRIPMAPPVTETPSGSIRGSWMTTRKGRLFQAYRGIRYAEPPVGELRFQPPKPILQYAGEVDASKEGPACPLPASPAFDVNEDCLTINVYTPSNDSTKLLPVIFYIHAGGFYIMSGRSDMAGPHYLLDRDVVLVTINYRLASLGFLSTGDALAPGNNGFKDQVVALRWVQKNIQAFGGDPNLVTISGCSAGSISVLLHMVSPMSKGLFHRSIAMSGSPVGHGPLRSDMYDLAVKQAQILDCPTNSSEAIINCLKTKSSNEFARSLSKFFNEFEDPTQLWMPVVERDFGQERFLTKDPAESIRTNDMHAVPLIISRTTDELFWKGKGVVQNEKLRNRLNNEWDSVAPVSFMLPPTTSSETKQKLRLAYLGDKLLADDDASAKALGKLYADAVIGYPVHVMANMMARHSPQKVFYSEFAYIGNYSHFQNPVDNKIPTGCAQLDDLIYLFTMIYHFPPTEVSEFLDSQVVDRMTAIWYNFAKYGDPNNPADAPIPELSNLKWPPMTSESRQYLRIGNEFSVHEKMFEDRYKVWEDIYPTEHDSV